MSKETGGPAFPVQQTELPNGERIWPEPGMTLRDYFAIHGPEPLDVEIQLERQKDRDRNPYNESNKPPLRSDREIRCELRYAYADTMLKERNK